VSNVFPVRAVLTKAEQARAGWSGLQQVIVAACVAVGVLIRAVALDRSLLSFDETFTANVARRSPSEIPSVLRATDSHPPLDYWLRHLVVDTNSTFWLRFPSLVLGLLTLLVVLWWMWNRGWFGVFVIALSSFEAIEVLYARQARMYALVILAGTIVAAVSERWLREPHTRWSLIVGVALVVGAFSHVSVLLLAGGAMLVPWLRSDRAAWIWRTFVGSAIVIWLVLWGPSFDTQRRHDPASWIPFTTVRGAIDAVAGQVSLYDGLAVVVVAAVVLGGVLLVRTRPDLGRLWLCLFAAPATVEILLGFRAHVLLARSLAFGAWAPVIALAALAAACVEGEPWPRSLSRNVGFRAAGVILVLVLAVPSIGDAFSYEEESSAARQVMIDAALPGDTVVVYPDWLGPMVRWDQGVRHDDPAPGFAGEDVWSAVVPRAEPTGRAWVLVPDTYAYSPPAPFVPCADVPATVTGGYGVSCYEQPDLG
jgi:uncharacterized membrane protein